MMAAVSAAVWILLLAGVPPGDAQREAGAILADPRYQTELPGAGGGSRAPAPHEVPEAGKGRGRGDPGSRGASATILSAIGELLFWTLVVVAGALLLWLLVLSIRARGKARRQGDATRHRAAAPADAAPAAAAPLGDAEEAARAGRIAEAIHLLLLHAIRIRIERAPAPPGPAETAREIAAGAPLPPAAAEAFRSLVATVEEIRYGGRAPEPDAFARSREQFRRIEASLRGSAA